MADGPAERIAVVGKRLRSPGVRTRVAGSRERLGSLWAGMFDSATDYVLVAALVVLGARNFLTNLGATSLHAWDEGIYANAAKHAVTEGYWLVPHVDGFASSGRGMELLPFFEKPPLVFWLQGLTMELLGVNEFAARFQSAVFGILTAVLLYLVGREILDRRAGFLAGVVFLTTPMLFTSINTPVTGATDMALVFFGSLLTYLVWRGVRENETRWLLYATVPAVGAVLSKGFDAGVWVVVLLPLLLLNPWILASRDTLRAVGIAGVAISVWPAYVWSRYGTEFWRVIFYEQVWLRVQGETGSETPGALFDAMRYPFFREFPVVFDPWAYLLVPGVTYLAWQYARTGDRGKLARVGFLAWWTACIFGFYATMGGNHPGQLLKAYVPAALLVGWFLREVSLGRPYSRVVLLGSVGLVVAFSPRTEELSPVTYLPPTPTTYVPGHPLRGWGFVALVGVAVALLLAWPVITARVRDRLSTPSPRIAATATGAVLVVVLAVALAGSPAIAAPHTAPHEELGGAMDRETPENATVYVTTGALEETAHNYAAVGFYSDRAMEELLPNEDPLSDPEVQYVVATAERFDGVDRSRYRVVYRFRSGYSKWDAPRKEMVFVAVEPRSGS